MALAGAAVNDLEGSTVRMRCESLTAGVDSANIAYPRLVITKVGAVS